MNARETEDFSQQDTRSAIQSHLAELDAASISDPKKRLDFAMALWSCCEFERGQEVIEELSQSPKIETAGLQSLAKLLFQIGRFGAAAKVMQRAVDRRDEKESECLEQLASCLERNNQKSEAIEAIRQTLTRKPTSSAAVRLQAHLYKRDEKYSEAIECLEAHLTNFPSTHDWALRYELAASLDRVGEYDRAWEELVKAKAQLKDRSTPSLEQSYRIRAKQGAVAKRMTDADLKHWHQMQSRVVPQRLAFLAGFPRSGTTLLEQILTSHPDCIGTDESGILLSQFTAPMVWNAEDDHAAILEIRGLDLEQIEIGRQAYRRFTESYLGEAVGDRLILEKDPLLTCDLAIPLRLFPDAKIIMPLRDPRDVAVSFFFTMVPTNWNSAPSACIHEVAKFYHDVMRHWLLLRERLPWATLETRYEDLVSDSEAESRRLTDFLELTWDPTIISVNKRNASKAISTPTYDDVTKPIYQRAVNRWENYAKFLEPAQPILTAYAKEFGY